MNSNDASPALDLSARVHAFLHDHALSPIPLLVGVSGGLDSTVLLRVLAELDLPLYASHIQYGLRGADSDADAAFVHGLCATLRIPLDTFHAPPVPSRGKQVWARELRYARWAYLAETYSLGAVAVAHHAEDQLETVLLNATRGAGIRGFGGMKPVRPWSASQPAPLVVRPLLDVSRVDILRYAQSKGWTWREDASNADAYAYARNRVRHQVVRPLAEWAGAGGMRSLMHALKHVQELEQSLSSLLPKLENHLLSIDSLRALPEVVQQYAVREAFCTAFPQARADERLTHRLMELLSQQPGKKVAFPGGEVRRVRDALWFVPEHLDEASRIPHTALQSGMTVETAAGTLTVRSDGPRDVPRIPHDGGPLWMRTWQAGDRVTPPGRSREIRVSDLLVKARVPLDVKPFWPVVGSGDRVVWVPGVGVPIVALGRDDEPSLYLSFDCTCS